METNKLNRDSAELISFNFLASLINGNEKTNSIALPSSKFATFNFLASLINGNYDQFFHGFVFLLIF